MSDRYVIGKTFITIGMFQFHAVDIDQEQITLLSEMVDWFTRAQCTADLDGEVMQFGQ